MDIEQELLIHCLKDTKALEAVLLRKLDKTYFTSFDASKLFEIILWVYNKYRCLLTEPVLKQLIEKSSVKSEEDRKQLLLYFHQVSQTTPQELPTQLVVDQFIEKYTHRTLETTLRSAAELIRDKNDQKAVDTLRTNLAKISSASSDEKLDEGYVGDDIDKQKQQYLNKKDNPGQYGGLHTGYPTFDKVTNGLHKGQIAVVMGAPKSAKSILMTNIAYNVIQNPNKRVLIVVNEGGRDLVLRRFASLAAQVNYTNLRDGILTSEEEAKYFSFLDSISKSKNLHITSIPPVMCTASLIQSKLEELERDGKFDLLIIDYLGLMESDNPITRKEDDWKKLGSITLELKSLAMIKQIPILTIIHANREGAKKKTGAFALTDVSRSYEVTKTVDLLISWRVVNEEEFELLHSGDIKLKIIAGRDCPPTMLEMYADLDMMRLTEKPGILSLAATMGSAI